MARSRPGPWSRLRATPRGVVSALGGLQSGGAARKPPVRRFRKTSFIGRSQQFHSSVFAQRRRHALREPRTQVPSSVCHRAPRGKLRRPVSWRRASSTAEGKGQRTGGRSSARGEGLAKWTAGPRTPVPRFCFCEALRKRNRQGPAGRGTRSEARRPGGLGGRPSSLPPGGCLTAGQSSSGCSRAISGRYRV